MPASDNNIAVSSTALSGWSVLVTRPAGQAESLCNIIDKAGGKAVRFPVIDISPVRNRQLDELLGQLDQFDIAIFISSNAVRYTMQMLADQQYRPQGLQIAAIGRATAAALEQAGWPADLLPDTTFNSEALLAMPQLSDVSGSRIIIFRGEGGRALLGETLVSRGAQVTYADVYCRTLPELDVKDSLQPWLQAEKRAVIATSQQGLENLLTLAGDEYVDCLQQASLVAISERVFETTRKYGMQGTIVIARQASDAAILDALIELSMQHAGDDHQ